MACRSIGQANPDIAGTGILVAFVIQSLIAVIVSGYTWILSDAIQKRWNAADPEPQTSRIEYEVTQWIRNFSAQRKAWFESFSLVQKCKEAYHKSVFYRAQEQTHAKLLAIFAWLIGKQPEHPRQRSSESKIEDEITPTTRRLECANRILLAGSDSQTFTGISLLISALAQSKTLNFYHMHIIYDTISLVIISNCAASVCIFREGIVKGYIRLTLIATWAVLFIAFICIFVTRLQKWDNDVPSHCYKTDATARPQDLHPHVDNIYIAVTLFYICLSFFYALSLSLGSQMRQLWNKLSEVNSSMGILGYCFTDIQNAAISLGYFRAMSSIYAPATDLQYGILAIAMLQCPLHIYSIFALRASNEHYLEGGSEKEWGLGQIAAVVLLGGNILQFVDGFIEHRKTAALDTRHNGDEEQPAGNQTDAS
ncbi:hypothetical protein F5882DRAFT_333458 [Hyaloscypha sp. PMI_1271]|nr:hypothetical protein F5882DRAFT_333458 [Hyaloscypha sp. PMI_1271]